MPTDINGDSGLTFIHLCKLSRILGDVLPHVHALNPTHDEISRHVRRLEFELDDWEATLPTNFRDLCNSDEIRANGVSNLRFCYLSVRLLLSRISYKVSNFEPVGGLS